MQREDYSLFQSLLSRIRIFLNSIFPLSNALQLIKPNCILSNWTKFSIPFPHPFLSQIPAQENHSKFFFAISSDISPSYPLYCLFLISYSAAAAAAKLLQSCPTLCDPIDGSPPGSPVPGILQTRTLEWVAISFSNAYWISTMTHEAWGLSSHIFDPFTPSHMAPIFTTSYFLWH